MGKKLFEYFICYLSNLRFLLQNSVDYAILGASSKLAAILLSYPFQVSLFTTFNHFTFNVIFPFIIESLLVPGDSNSIAGNLIVQIHPLF